MRTPLVALFLITATAAGAADGKSAILDAIDMGVKAQLKMRSALVSRDAATDDETKLIYWTEARDEQAKAKSAYDRAIVLVQAEYSIKIPTPQDDPVAATPKSPDGAWAAGISAPQTVEFSLPAYRSIKGSDGVLHYISDNIADNGREDALAFTDPDGRTLLFTDIMGYVADNHDPGMLALTLHHENIHYRELTTTGWDSYEDMEIRAFKDSLSAVDSFIPATSPVLRTELKKSMTSVIVDFTERVRVGKTRSTFPTPEQERFNRRQLEKQQDEEKEYAALVQRVDRLRREQRERQTSAEKDLRWSKFKVWTLYACTYINGFHEGDPEWGRPDLIRAREQFLRDYLRSNLVVMAKDEIDAGLRRNDLLKYGDLGRCHGQMVGMIRELPGPVDEDWLMDRIEYDRQGGRTGEIISGLLESVRQAVKDGTAAIVQSASAPFSGDRASGNDTRGSDHGYSMPDADKLPYRQLRGINNSGW